MELFQVPLSKTIFWILLSFQILASACSCGIERLAPEKLPDQDLAVKIVWVNTFKAKGKPPTIIWDRTWECGPDSKGFYAELKEEKIKTCVAGVYYNKNNVAVISDLQKPFSEMALAHELMHAFENANGIYDPDHLEPGFQPGGLVELANKALKEAGL